jgi:mannose-6-phosphate isomerase-like protein (cupin superfamily)
MEAVFRHPDIGEEYLTPEGCWILESWNTSVDEAVSIARARVKAGVTTKLHRLGGITERYLIIEGSGVAKIGTLEAHRVGPGDVVVIPAGVPQQISNDGDSDLVFYCICTPRFRKAKYEALE